MLAGSLMLVIPLVACGNSDDPAADGASEVHSTADVFDQYLSEFPEYPDKIEVHGTSELVRSDDGVSMTLETSGLTPGDAYTVWWAVVDHPELCERPWGDYWCSPPEFDNPELGISLIWATGAVVEGDTAEFEASLAVGDTTYVVPDEETGREGEGLMNPSGALISVIVRDHGPEDADTGDQLNDMMACNPECVDVQESIHIPSPVDQWAADFALVNESVEQYRDLPAALAAGHTGEFGCVPGDLPFFAGATGIHFGDVPATIDGDIDLAHPQVLLYMPTEDLDYELVAYEWMVLDKGQEPPELLGRQFESFDTSVVPPLMNALGLASDDANVFFFHVWGLPEFINFRGTFKDSNPDLLCPLSPILGGGDFAFGHASGIVGSGAGDLSGSRLHVLFEAGIIDEDAGPVGIPGPDEIPEGQEAPELPEPADSRLDAYWLDEDGEVLQEAHGVVDCLEIDGADLRASGRVAWGEGSSEGDAFALTIMDAAGDTGDLQTATSFALDVLPSGTVESCEPATSSALDVDHGTLTFGPPGSLPLDQLLGGDDDGDGAPPGIGDGPPGDDDGGEGPPGDGDGPPGDGEGSTGS